MLLLQDQADLHLSSSYVNLKPISCEFLPISNHSPPSCHFNLSALVDRGWGQEETAATQREMYSGGQGNINPAS